MRNKLNRNGKMILLTTISLLLVLYFLLGTDLILPNSEEALVETADEFFELGNYEEALDNYLKALKKKENNVEIQKKIVMTHLANGMTEDARKQVDEYLELNPHSLSLLDVSLAAYSGSKEKLISINKLIVKVHEDNNDGDSSLPALTRLIYDLEADEDEIFEKYLLYSKYSEEEAKILILDMYNRGFSNEYVKEAYSKFYPSALQYIVTYGRGGFIFNFEEELADEVKVTNMTDGNEIYVSNKHHVTKRNFSFYPRLIDEKLTSFKITLYKDFIITKTLFINDFLITNNPNHTDIDKAQFLVLLNIDFDEVESKVDKDKLVSLYQTYGDFNLESALNLVNLRMLTLDETDNKNMHRLSDFTKLEYFSIRNKSFNSKELSDSKNIRVLRVENNHVNVNDIAKMSDLIFLSLESNSISGVFGEHLKMRTLLLYPKEELNTKTIETLNSPNLVRLDLNNISGEIIDFPEFESLEILHLLDSPSLHGDISLLSKYSKLSLLKLHGSKHLYGKVDLVDENIDLDAKFVNVNTKYYNNTLSKNFDESGFYVQFNDNGTYKMYDMGERGDFFVNGTYYFSGDKIYCRRSEGSVIMLYTKQNMFEFAVLDDSSLKLISRIIPNSKGYSKDGDVYSIIDD